MSDYVESFSIIYTVAVLIQTLSSWIPHSKIVIIVHHQKSPSVFSFGCSRQLPRLAHGPSAAISIADTEYGTPILKYFEIAIWVRLLS